MNAATSNSCKAAHQQRSKGSSCTKASSGSQVSSNEEEQPCMKSKPCAFAPESRHRVKGLIQANLKLWASALPVRLRPAGDCPPSGLAVYQWHAEAAKPPHHQCRQLVGLPLPAEQLLHSAGHAQQSTPGSIQQLSWPPSPCAAGCHGPAAGPADQLVCIVHHAW